MCDRVGAGDALISAVGADDGTYGETAAGEAMWGATGAWATEVFASAGFPMRDRLATSCAWGIEALLYVRIGPPGVLIIGEPTPPMAKPAGCEFMVQLVPTANCIKRCVVYSRRAMLARILQTSISLVCRRRFWPLAHYVPPGDKIE